MPAPIRTFSGVHHTDTLYVYTDGSCFPNPGPGGWAFVATRGQSDVSFERYGHKHQTTNNEMELTAILEAIKAFPDYRVLYQSFRPPHIMITDSRYAIRCITEWGPHWKANGWRTLNGDTAPANLEIVQEIMMRVQLDQLPLMFFWVRGHKGVRYNERADLLAGIGRARAKSELIAASPGAIP